MHLADILSDEQLEAYIKIFNFIFNTDKKYYVLNGYAGTGKTYLISKIISAIHSHTQETCSCLTLTGKASSVLSARGIPNVSTIHAYMYYPEYNEHTGEFVRWVFTKDSPTDDILFVDESSMLDTKIVDDLLSSTTSKVIFIGDDAQLPSISKDNFSINDTPDFILKDNKRMAAGSPIIKLANQIRSSGVLNRSFQCPEIQYQSLSTVNMSYFKSNPDIDIVLCGTNKVKDRMNRTVRKSLGYCTDIPGRGEILINLKNGVLSNTVTRIFNGERFKIIDCSGSRYTLQSIDIAEKIIKVTIDQKIWDDWQDGFSQKNQLNNKYSNREGQFQGVFTWGYALTVHKSQGSEFNKVLFIDENVSRFTDRKKFRYTAITRAAKNIIIAS